MGNMLVSPRDELLVQFPLRLSKILEHFLSEPFTNAFHKRSAVANEYRCRKSVDDFYVEVASIESALQVL
jgi:hypothetical protein